MVFLHTVGNWPAQRHTSRHRAAATLRNSTHRNELNMFRNLKLEFCWCKFKTNRLFSRIKTYQVPWYMIGTAPHHSTEQGPGGNCYTL